MGADSKSAVWHSLFFFFFFFYCHWHKDRPFKHGCSFSDNDIDFVVSIGFCMITISVSYLDVSCQFFPKFRSFERFRSREILEFDIFFSFSFLWSCGSLWSKNFWNYTQGRLIFPLGQVCFGFNRSFSEMIKDIWDRLCIFSRVFFCCLSSSFLSILQSPYLFHLLPQYLSSCLLAYFFVSL